MSMVNVSLVGNLVKAPEQVCFASGKVKTTLVIAVNSQTRQSIEKGGDSADFYRVETWGKLAELAQKYLNKGNQIGLSGRLIMEHWTDKQGRERLTPVISAHQLSFPQRSKSGSGVDSTRTISSIGLEEEAEDQEMTKLERSHRGELEYSDGSELLTGSRAVSVAEPRSRYHSQAQNKTVSRRR